jgi:hypothetical protein
VRRAAPQALKAQGSGCADADADGQSFETYVNVNSSPAVERALV